MLRSLRMANFRGFQQFRVNFSRCNYLIGPNNAGKSTILTALRLSDTLLRYAYRRNPDFGISDNGRYVLGYPISLSEYPALRDSIRYESYADEATRLEITWTNQAKLVAVWPEEAAASEAPYFYLETLPGLQPKTTKAVRLTFPAMGVIPVLTPIEHTETLLQDKYLKQSVSTRLSSRHFRNNLYSLQENQASRDFYDMVTKWTEEVSLEEVTLRQSDEGFCLDLFYGEPDSRIPKELVWAGDGIQIWLQILYHLVRIVDNDAVVLDEPEVYLHPDLQRRLVRVLEDSGKQIIMATHSAEIMAEIDPADTILIDKKLPKAIRTKTAALEEALGTVLGTQFNLRLAKALRSNVVVFVEGNELQLLRPLFRTLKLTSLVRETRVSFVDLGGFSMWTHLQPFEWFVKDLLKESVTSFVLLDRDYRSDEQVISLERDLLASGLIGHVWRRKEIESYLVTPSIVAAATKMPKDEIKAILDEVTQGLEATVFSRLVAEAIQAKGGGSQHHATVTAQIKIEFDKRWPDDDYRLKVVPPKQLLSGTNQHLQANGNVPTSIRALARSAARRQIDSEMVTALETIESALAR